MKTFALLPCVLAISCKVKPAEEPGSGGGSSQPQQSLFCSSAYPNGVAQDDPANPPLLKVLIEAGGFESHWRIGFGRATEALGSGTGFIGLTEESEDLPHLIVETVVNPSGNEVNVKVSGREDVFMSATPDGGADARILFTFSLSGAYEYLTALHEAAAEQVALYVIGGWTCNGDTPVPTRSF